MDIIQSTIYYALRNIDFGFITARKNGKLVVAEDIVGSKPFQDERTVGCPM